MPTTPNDPDVTRQVDHLFRRESGRLVAILIRYFGLKHLPLVEDVVQDALVKAMQTWPFTGVPLNPSAWLLQTAKNRAIDQTRRDLLWRGKQSELSPLIEDCLRTALHEPVPQFEDEIRDSQLRMMFVCCHPGLPAEAQVALTLKTLCGFGEKEIVAAFLTTEPVVTKRLVRARQWLREHEVAMELPPAAELAPRLDSVWQVLYLLFNEGYKASHGDSLLRADLCAEAIRLAELLLTHPLGDCPATHALLALMHLNAARLPARTDGDGSILLLAEQDRTLWNQSEIKLGLQQLEASGTGSTVTRYHLEAGIAACHCLAHDYAATDWRQIVELYDQLLMADDSPVVALNRAVALAQTEGPRAGLTAINGIKGQKEFKNYHLLHAVAGHLWFEAKEWDKAKVCFRCALELATLPAERTLLEKRLKQCGS